MAFRSLHIKDYQNLQNFTMRFNNSSERGLNINVLVGRNGSGKSNVIDALFEIGKNCGNTAICPFEFCIEEDNKEKWGNYETELDKQNNEQRWNRVIRFYTGDTDRSNNSFLRTDEKNISIEVSDCKWILLSMFLNGSWNEERAKENSLWREVESLVLGNNPKSKNSDKIEPEIFWLETDINFKDKNQIELEEENIFNKLPEPDFFRITTEGKYKLFWYLKNIKISDIESLPLTLQILKRVNSSKDFIIYDTGFLFKKLTEKNNSDDLFPSERLSDGEHGFLGRFALIMLLRATNEKMLVLLDEPETHFNEYWKSYFISLICKALKDYNHDIFIASHSAMLITDVKPEELHRLEIYGGQTVAHPPPINTYGVNVVDIGRSLFLMESDIGERARNDIEEAIRESLKNKKTEKLEELLHVVGPGEWRWKIRQALRKLENEKNHEENTSS